MRVLEMVKAMAYINHPHHRDLGYAFLKSQWTISTADEVNVFNNAFASNWRANNDFWGLNLSSSIPMPLGVSQMPAAEELKIAKFVSDNSVDWHGYPVAHWINPWDKPGMSVLKAWCALGYITAASKSRIHRGKKCTL